MALEDLTVGFIGSGVMGEAFIKGLLHKKLIAKNNIIASDPHAERGKELQELYGIKTTTDNLEATKKADILILSIKPQVSPKVLKQLRGHADHCSVVISIMAGIRIDSIASELLNNRVVRSMPNTPGQIGKGITVWTASQEVENKQKKQVKLLFGALGDELYFDEERFIDMATALSATGPSYVFMFMEALIDAGVHLGFSRRDAEHLVLQTMRGSVEYAIESGRHPVELRNQVTSPGGTSADAIYQLEKGGMRTVVSRAVYAAYQKAHILGGQDITEND